MDKTLTSIFNRTGRILLIILPFALAGCLREKSTPDEKFDLIQEQDPREDFDLIGDIEPSLEFDLVDEVEPKSQSNITFDQFIGMCVLPDDPLERIKAAGYVRPYILSKWYLYDTDHVNSNLKIEDWEMAFSPSYAGGWKQDGFYREMHENGIFNVPTFKESFMFLTNNSKPDLDNKPRKYHEDGLDPYSWRYMAAYFYQFAARYGHTQVPDNTLLLRGDQERLTGAGWVQWMQLENEWDKWWLGPDSEFSAEEYAAYHSACYDGHMNTIKSDNPNVKFGIKNADPEMKVVLGPLAHLDYNKLERVFAWWRANRTDSRYPVYPLDAVSFHRYANSSGRQRDLSGKGQSPEEFGFKTYAEELVNWTRKQDPKLQTWITEFGYDTHSGTPQGINAFGGLSTEDIQAMWLLRSYLAFSAAGIDRAAMYMLRNVHNYGSGIFQTSGLTSTKGSGWQPKTSWYYLSSMKYALTDMQFTGEVPSGQDDVMIYSFKHISESKRAYAIWCPTSSNKKVNNYQLGVDGQKVMLITPKKGADFGKEEQLNINNGNIELNVSEKPKFILIE